MAHLESEDVWQEIVPLLDRHPLTELAGRFDVEIHRIVHALKRTGTARKPVKKGEEAEARERPRRDPDDEIPPEKGATLPPPRPGSKDADIAEHAHLLGQVPDGEVAEEAGVSKRTVANYRSRHGIPAYRRGGSKRPSKKSGRSKRAGRRSKVEPYRHLLGEAPDRTIADKAGVTVAAVRSYRHRHGIPGPGRAASQASDGSASKQSASKQRSEAAPPAAAGGHAWRVRFAGTDEAQVRVVVAPDAAGAAARAAEAGLGPVLGMERLDPVLEA